MTSPQGALAGSLGCTDRGGSVLGLGGVDVVRAPALAELVATAGTDALVDGGTLVSHAATARDKAIVRSRSTQVTMLP